MGGAEPSAVRGCLNAKEVFADEDPYPDSPQGRENQFVLNMDEQYRRDISLESLAKLSGIYGCKGVTARNAPGLNDGAARRFCFHDASAGTGFGAGASG